MMYGKQEEPKRHVQPTKSTICWCGDPSCPGDLRDLRDLRSEREAAPEQAASSIPVTGMNLRDFARQILRDPALANPFVMVDTDAAWLTPSQPATPQSYSAARNLVEQYVVDVQHDTAWDDIVGNDAARNALIEAIEEPKRHPELYAYYGMKPPKGVMLYGPPGCGKTMFAKACAAAISRVYGTKAEVLVINGPSIQSPYVGKTEEAIRNIFAYAREYQAFRKHPLAIFFDEAEALFPDRTGRVRRVAPWEESQVAQFLAEMDGLNSMGAFVILATNRPEAIDEALLRDGRCDRKIKVERPTKEAVEHIVRKSFSNAPLGVNIDDLVMAAAESFFNPHYVIHEGHAITAMINGSTGETEITKHVAVNFCLEHIVSGAMAASVSQRSRSRAFARDRVSGKREGVLVADVLGSVTEIFEENKGLEHAFALREFVEGLGLKASLKSEVLQPKGRLQ